MLAFSLNTPQKPSRPLMVDKITCETTIGALTLLPRHIDCVAELTPSVLSYFMGGSWKYMAVNGGVLVKQGKDVSISTPFAVVENDLEKLKNTVKTEFKRQSEEEKKSNNSMVHLEAALAKMILELRKT